MRSSKLITRVLTSLTALAFAALGAASCSIITDSDIAPAGLGAACVSDADCQASTCDRGICVAKCTQDTDCPAPTRCFSGLCQEQLKVRGVWVGVIGTGEGWTLTHHEGIEVAKQNLPYIDFAAKEELVGDPVLTAIDDFVADGAQVVIANSFDHRTQIKEAAEKYPNTIFLLCSGKAQPPNIGSYFAHLEQAWFVAGQVAARKTTSKHLGFVGSYITPEVVRHLNAFTLGARSHDSDIVVEVRWTGFWYDPGFLEPAFEYTPLHMGTKAKLLKLTAEEYMTAKLIDSGADVVAHQIDNQLVSRYVSTRIKEGAMVDGEGNPKQVWTIANDNRYGWRGADNVAYTNAIGAVYWNWGPMYTRMLDQIHRKQWTPSDVMENLTDLSDSAVGFELSTDEQQITSEVVRSLVVKSQDAGPDAVFRGPWNSTGQREQGNMKAGETIAASEYATMCWFVEGVVERKNPNSFDDVASPLVAAKVPDKTHVPKMADTKPPTTGDRQPTTAPEAAVSFADPPELMWDCTSNR